ncbi:tubulin-tyrosine ligase family-domain-containing protein [Cladochytrium replicatum]|nr:tubulin-tyrosine ligase family-domain-containing protein [Cladochytrium replicatum]
MSRKFPSDYKFFPKTWTLPIDWEDLSREIKSRKQSSRRRTRAFIAKPDHGCQGKGIFVFRNLKDIVAHKSGDMVVQSYISRPLLIDGFKFDLRVYVLVTSVDPLRVFVYNDGLARLATEPYRPPTESNVDNVFIHLTNYAINKRSENFDRQTGEKSGSKRTIGAVKRHLEALGHDVETVWTNVCDVIMKTLLTVHPQLRRMMRVCFPERSRSSPGSSGDKQQLDQIGSCCFEILGFDILLDRKLKPWVLEVNHSPSFTCDTELDREIKQGVILGALKLLNLDPMGQRRFEKDQKLKTRSRLLGKQLRVSSKGQNSPSRSPACKSPPNPTQPQSKDLNSEANGKPTPTTKSSNQKIQLLMEMYQTDYPEHLLATLTEIEDANMGSYQRIFPPTDLTKLGNYLLFADEADKMAGDTASTKGRKEYLKKKYELDEKQRQESTRRRTILRKRQAELLATRVEPASSINREGDRKKREHVNHMQSVDMSWSEAVVQKDESGPFSFFKFREEDPANMVIPTFAPVRTVVGRRFGKSKSKKHLERPDQPRWNVGIQGVGLRIV